MKMPAEHIREEILKSGAISFARFMELALYCPETGYYEKKKDNVGYKGDFITSVSVGNLFGELLAFQFAAWLEELQAGGENPVIIEAGGHDGKLAGDILNWLHNHRPGLFSKIEYRFLEPSARRQQWQRQTLKDFENVSWVAGFEDFSRLTPDATQQCGVLFSNELLDALPVHRLGWSAAENKWFEWGATLDGGTLAWVRIPVSLPLSSAILNLPSSLLEVLPDDYTIEVSPAAEEWWFKAAGILRRGKLLTIDYGFTEEGMFLPGRLQGTLRAYARHHVSHDLLAKPGEQDLTAHVNFSAIERTGKKAGLRTEMFCRQPQFLTRILREAMEHNFFGAWDAKLTRQFQTLTHPEHLGRAFRVLVQSR